MMNIAVLGAIGPEKGARHVERMVERIRARALPLRVVVIGYTDRESRCQSDDKVLTVHGPYDVAHVEALLSRFDGLRILKAYNGRDGVLTGKATEDRDPARA